MKRVLTGVRRNLNGKIVEMTGRRKDTQEVPLEMSLAEWSDDNRSYFTGFIRDITERKMIEREIQAKTLELTKANIELEQFAYVASHDLREPLRMVNSFLTLLERRNPELDAESKEFLSFAKDGAVRMDGLVLALLDLSRVGRISCEFGLIDSASAVAEAIANLQVQIQESDSNVEIADAMPMVTGNRDELVRLFQNLIANAIKYRHPDRHPVIRVSCGHCQDGWQFAVADNGIGIAHEYFERIFWIFQRLHTREKYEGTGIGLAICKKIVEFHGGHIWVESDPGQGSIFCFTLPEAGETEPTMPEMERAADVKVNEIVKAPTRPHREGPQT
jgi:light-regulated signal transduction histidine kinase (bacteriophytochrome)